MHEAAAEAERQAAVSPTAAAFFADEIGEGVELQLPQVGEADFARFKTEARHFLRAPQHSIVLHKLRQGKRLTPSDLRELEKLLLDAGVGEAGDIERVREVFDEAKVVRLVSAIREINDSAVA